LRTISWFTAVACTALVLAHVAVAKQAEASTGAAKPSSFALARRQWILGGYAGAAIEGLNWSRAAKDLTAGPPVGSAARRAAALLEQLASLPDAQQTPAQQRESIADFEALNAFFSTNGLAGVNAPSATTAAFVATLQQEARLGTLSANAPKLAGKIPAAFPGATVTCPILPSLTVDELFGCRLKTPTAGSYLLVGTFSAAHGTSYEASILSVPVFQCPDLDAAEQAVIRKLGGACR
jgi:hypothetical protein